MPTKSAQLNFQMATQFAGKAAKSTIGVDDPTARGVYDIANSLVALTQGLNNLAIGLRATYILLEHVEKKLDRR